jgi:hypothetical protein
MEYNFIAKMLPSEAPKRGDVAYSMDLGQNDSAYSKSKNVNLTVSRSNRRKSIEDNILIPNVKFVTPESRTMISKGLEHGSLTNRINNNDTYNSRLQTDDESTFINDSKDQKSFDRKHMNASALSPGIGQSGSALFKNASGTEMKPTHSRMYNKSFDSNFSRHRQSPGPENTYK